MKNRSINHRNDWSTPKDFYDALNEKYSFSDFDPCPIDASATGFDGLAAEQGELADWPDRVFINPPYSQQLKTAFVETAVFNTIMVGHKYCLLLPVSTSTALFHQVIKPNASKLEFVRGRLKFEGVNSEGQWVNPGTGRRPHPAADLGLEQVKACGMHDSMLVFFGDWERE